MSSAADNQTKYLTLFVYYKLRHIQTQQFLEIEVVPVEMKAVAHAGLMNSG
jgi:hypothetical protein